jgi:hypothetical protein
MYANEPIQLGCTFYKPAANSNEIMVQLRRVSDGTVVHTETFAPPYTGVWYTWQGQWFALPNTVDQVYTLEFYLVGAEPDEIYLSNLYCNIAGIQYMFQPGDITGPMLDVTPLVYADNTHVTVNSPVNEFSFHAHVWNPNCWAYGATLTPRYLQ